MKNLQITTLKYLFDNLDTNNQKEFLKLLPKHELESFKTKLRQTMRSENFDFCNCAEKMFYIGKNNWKGNYCIHCGDACCYDCLIIYCSECGDQVCKKCTELLEYVDYCVNCGDSWCCNTCKENLSHKYCI
jgi:hypothetical protein